MITNKKIAGLLWGILPLKNRSSVNKFLTKEELTSLQQILEEYKQLTIEQKYELQKKLFEFFCKPISGIYFLLIVFTFLFFVFFFSYIILYSKITPFFLFSLFWPFALGIFSFYLILTIPKYDFRLLFRIPKKMNAYIISFLIFYLIFFIFFLINQKETQFIKLNSLEKIILGIGITFAPLSEEIVFRYKIPKMICNQNTIFCIYFSHSLSNIGFSLLHLTTSFEEFLLYFFSGMFFSLLRIEFQSLLLPFFVHSLANLSIFLVFNF